MEKTGVLLVNLGTPKSTNPWDVFRYLNEFLTDERVIDIPWLPRQLLVRGVITPFRCFSSARAYQTIWTDEGSPLMVYGKAVQRILQEKLGEKHHVALAMRYQNPSIKDGINKLRESSVDKIVVLPLFPQYASATTGSIYQKVVDEIAKWQVVPELRFIRSYSTQPKMIQAFTDRIRAYPLAEYDKILFSFHGLPKRHILKADQNSHCLKNPNCCETLSRKNSNCYSAQCYATAHAIVKELSLSKEKYAVTFQSRLGKDPWIEPYTSETLENYPSQGHKKVLVVCPAFVCDCLETLYEIGIEEKEKFLEKGGERLDLVTGLNDHPLWVEALSDLVQN